MRKLILSIFYILSFINIVAAQDRIITGTVGGREDGKPLPGVTVKIKGTRGGTQTDAAGRFSIPISARAKELEFAYLGYVPQTVAISSATVLHVLLVSDSRSLSEVVVTGYGTITKGRQTGSVSTVAAKDLEVTPFTSVDKALQGRVPGLRSVGASGQPGAMQQIRIRGLGSITGSSEPLYVIDGIPVNSGDLSVNTTTTNALAGINPNDIESMTILKDASSTAIYGSRGSNGVVLITTKSGKSGKTKIRLDAEYGTVKPGVYNDKTRPLTTEENILLIGESLLNNPAYVNAYGLTADNIREFVISEDGFGIDPSINTDWYDEVTRNGTQQQYNLSVDGGNDKTQFHFGGGYFTQEGTVLASSFKRYSGNLNLKHQVNAKLSFATNIMLSSANTKALLNAGAFGNPVLGALFIMPNYAARNADGSPNISGGLSPGGGLYNPLAILAWDKASNNTQKAITTLSAEYKLFPNLKFSSKYGIDYNSIEEDSYNNPSYGDGLNDKGRSYRDYGRYFNWVWTNLVDYRWEIDPESSWVGNVKAGYEAQKSQYYSASVASYNLPLNTNYTVPSVGATPITAEGSGSSYTFASLLALGDISYKNKYVLSGSFRRDGSSRFGADNIYGNFWSAGGSWNAHEEDFIKSLSFISQLKFRGSYGINGNAGIGNNAWRNLYGYTRTTYNFVYNGNIGSGPIQYGVSTLTWEKTKAADIALDLGFFKDRLNATIEWYNRQSDDLLLATPVSFTSGFSSYIDNLGGMRNRGWEFSVNGSPVKTDDLEVSLNFNISLNKNKLTSLVTDKQISSPFIRQVGEDYQSYYLPQYAGVNVETGAPQWYADETRTAVVTSYSQAKRALLGKSAAPKAFGSFGATVSYKGIGLDALFYYNFGNYIYNGFFQYQNSGGAYIGSYNQSATELERWQKPGDITSVPKLIYDNPTNSYGVSDRLLYKGDYIRLRDITLSYKFPQILLDKISVASLRLYVRGSNIWTWVKDDRLPFDPEAGGTGGTNNFELFIPKTVTFGLNVGF